MADLSAQMGELQMAEGADMLLDECDPVDEKPEVAIINPDDATEEQEAEPLADDCKGTSVFRLRPGLHLGRREHERTRPPSYSGPRNRKRNCFDMGNHGLERLEAEDKKSEIRLRRLSLVCDLTWGARRDLVQDPYRGVRREC